MNWNVFSGTATGVRVEGDKSQPPTRWWNYLFLVRWGWKKCAALKLKDPALATNGYRVGYVPLKGKAQLCSTFQTGYGIRMKIGHEDCTFFAVDRNDKEVPLVLHAVASITDMTYEGFTLL